jgi:hypothetical protein
MTQGTWLPLLQRQTAPGAPPPSWDEMLVGHDFGLLSPDEIQGWVRAQEFPFESCRTLAALEGEGLVCFEKALWDAITEATGKAPRPGGQRWAKAQDRWRVALLKDALESPVSPEALAVLVEAIYEAVGCPEDMLDLWRRPAAGPSKGTADREKVQAFLTRWETAVSF